MKKKTKIIIAVVAVAIVAAIGLQVFMYSEKQKGLMGLEAQVNQNSQVDGTSSELTPLPTATPTATPSASPTATPEITPEPSATPKPEATPKSPQKPVSNTPQDGDMRDNGGQQQKYIDGFGWVNYAGAGGTIENVDIGEFTGNQVGQ